MSGGHSIHTDESLLSRIDQALFRLESGFALISGIAVFSLILLAVVSVSGRNFFNAPLPGYVDWIEQIMPIIAFLGIAYIQRLGGHIRMDLFIGMAKGRTLWATELATTLLILLLMLVMVYGSFTHFQRSFDFNAPMWSRDSSMDIALPLWPAKLLAPIAFSLLCLRLSIQVWAYGRALRLGGPHSVAIPLIEDAAEQASKEAATVSGFDDEDNRWPDDKEK